MPFPVKVYLQGVMNYVPHENEQRVLTFIPDQQHEVISARMGKREKKICMHGAEIQFIGLIDKEKAAPDEPRRIDFSGMWVQPGATSTSVEAKLHADGRIDGLPDLGDIFRATGALISSQVSKEALGAVNGPAPDYLRAAVHLNQGQLKADTRYLSTVMARGRDTTMTFTADCSNTLCLDLGEVESFWIDFRALRGERRPTRRVHIAPWGFTGSLEIWIRHYCELGWPHRLPKRAKSEAMDMDFLLNYGLLRAKVIPELMTPLTILPQSSMLKVQDKVLHIPVDTVGGRPIKCYGSLLPAEEFGDPFSNES